MGQILRFLIFLGFSILIFNGCATTTFVQDFKRLRLGMDMGDVVERVGTPQRKDHREDKDWWYYTAFEEGERIDRMVVFKEFKLIYAGRVAKAPHAKDAIAEDRKIQEANEEIEADTERARVNSVPMSSGPSGVSSP